MLENLDRFLGEETKESRTTHFMRDKVTSADNQQGRLLDHMIEKNPQRLYARSGLKAGKI